MNMPYAVVIFSLSLAITTATSVSTNYTNITEYPAQTTIHEPKPIVLGVAESQTLQVNNPEFTPVKTLSEEELQTRAIQNTLQKYKSPMQDSAPKYVEVAAKYNIDWTLLPAISGVESTFGKFVPQNSYNPFGWGNGQIKFESWEDAIEKVGNGLNRIYYQRGYTTPELIQPIYAPPSKTWAQKVNYFSSKFEEAYQTEKAGQQ